MFDPMAALSRLPKSGRGPGLERLKAHFGPLWAEFPAVPILHVVGSNGKGSTAFFLEALLRQAGFSTGLFTSPHYRRFGERIRIDGRNSDDAAIEGAFRFFEKGAADNPDFGGFEAMTIMAARIFADACPDVLIVEAGIGGRLDPTRLFGGEVAILTSVDLEHTELLGPTPEAIAADKMDVLDRGGTIIAGWLGDRLARFCAGRAVEAGLRFKEVTGPLELEVRESPSGSMLRLADRPSGPTDYRIPAEYFVRNSLLALRAAEILLPDRAAAIRQAFAPTCSDFTLAGRFERVSSNPLVYCDVAHTPGAVAEVAATCGLLFPDARPAFVLGMSNDKHFREMCALLAPLGSQFLLFPARHKGEPPASLAAAIRAVRPEAPIKTFESAEAVAAAVKTGFADSDAPIVATGGLFSAIEFRTAMAGEDPAALNFY
jgi:folylpolyglutamate synthase/dihydrofolate synthase